MTDLLNWHNRLARHFQELSRTRQQAGPGRSIFALEHGLDAHEVQALASAVRAHVSNKMPSWDHALAWIVYSAEVGYRYCGDEYWQTFEQETPGWTQHGNRSWIRDCYRWFQKEYGGAEPSGTWAEHFTIICWPIRHAILPQDLQRQLARILYELRHSFSAELFESPSRLGEFIAARSWNATSRFQSLAQETHLLGQIAAALLLQGDFGTDRLIHAATLHRIGEDLEGERRGREWLRGARRFAKERARIRGLAANRSTVSTDVLRPDEARREVVALGIEPRMVLRPTDASKSSWDVSLEIPDLSHLLLRFPKTRDILAGCRCTVAGAAGRPLARGRLLHGAQRVTLSRWPRTDEVLLEFEQTDPQLEYLLRTECLLRPGPSWLFRIASDGLAYESRSLRVRPGERYILVNTDGSIELTDYARLIDLKCDGVHGAILDLPQALTPDWENVLGRLGLGHARTIEVWPAGLGAVVWDGEGHGEWLVSERPCLAILTDHPRAALHISMVPEADQSVELRAVTPGEPIFVELPQLSVGLHTVRVCARDSPEADAQLLGDLDVVMRIREARPWSPEVSPRGPLIVQMDPSSPTLEQLWEGQVDIDLRGPPGRRLTCSVSLYDAEVGSPTIVKELPPIALPVTSDAWKRHFERHFQRTREVPFAYDIARVCQIEFTCEELGAFSIRAIREFTPLRWAVRHDGQEYVARLLDDTGDASSPQVVRLAFETPCIEESLDPAPSYVVPSSGGLYLARGGASATAVIIPPKIHGLTNLGCNPRINAQERSTLSVLRAVAMTQTWAQARLTGDLFSRIRQQEVLQALTLHIVGIVGGNNWAAAELAAKGNTDQVMDLKGAVSRRREETAIGEAMAADVVALAAVSCKERVQRVASLAVGSHLLSSPTAPNSVRTTNPNSMRIDKRGDPEWLAEFALRLASAPWSVAEWAGVDLHQGTTRLLEVPTLARAARFLVIATDRHMLSRTAPGELYATWGWA